MTFHTNKHKNASTHAAGSKLSRERGAATVRFVDNRTEAVAQRRMIAVIKNSAQVMQLAAWKTVIQGQKISQAAQRMESTEEETSSGAHDNQGLPSNLRTGIENLSGVDVSDVQVHYNSDKPAQLHAHAYAQGADIHVAPGQEKQLPHEAWHIVQQKQGRVKPTMQMKSGVFVNDDASLENEADVMGAKAASTGSQALQKKSLLRTR